MKIIKTDRYQLLESNTTYYFDPTIKKCIIERTNAHNITLIINHDLDLLFLHQDQGAKAEITINLVKPNIEMQIRELALVDHSHQFHKTITISHQGVRTKSDYQFFGFAINQSQLQISAKSMIKKGMRQSEAHQILRILTDDQAKATGQPGLFIDDFDVKASHGNAIGQIDKRQLYYLQTKGISLLKARWMIMEGHMLAALKMIDEKSKQVIINNLKAKLGLGKDQHE